MYFLFVKESTVEYAYFAVRVVAQGLLIKDDHGSLPLRGMYEEEPWEFQKFWHSLTVR